MTLHHSAWALTVLIAFLPAHGQVAEEGRQIYNSSCTACHGHDGAAGDRAPALAAARRYTRVSERDLVDAIRHGIPGTAMPASALSETDASKVAAYIRSLRATAIDTPVQGDVATGERIFWAKGKCGECHMLGGRGGLLGPELSNIASQRKLSAIEDALTKPKPPSQGFVPVQVIDKDGHVISGVLKNEHNFSLQVLGSDNTLHLFDRDKVRKVTYEPASLMPNDYAKRLTSDELRDLLAFLTRQGTRAQQRASRGNGNRSEDQ